LQQQIEQDNFSRGDGIKVEVSINRASKEADIHLSTFYKNSLHLLLEDEYDSVVYEKHTGLVVDVDRFLSEHNA